MHILENPILYRMLKSSVSRWILRVFGLHTMNAQFNTKLIQLVSHLTPTLKLQ